LLGMLHERYLVNLPRLKKDKSEWYDTSSLRLRWLWCSWMSKVFGWKETRPEGHPKGLSVDVYIVLREKIFSIPKVERNVVARSSTKVAGKALPLQGGSIRHSPTCCLYSGPSTSGTFGSGGCGVMTPAAGCGCRGSTCISVGSGGVGLYPRAGSTSGASVAMAKCLHPGYEVGGATGREWLQAMRVCGFLDGKIPSYGQRIPPSASLLGPLSISL
jgi:hypothetical protein